MKQHGMDAPSRTAPAVPSSQPTATSPGVAKRGKRQLINDKDPLLHHLLHE